MTSKCALIAALAVSVLAGACTKTPEPEPQPQAATSASLDGLTVPGTPDDAKRTGFTACQTEYSTITCTRSNFKFMGWQVDSASVKLEKTGIKPKGNDYSFDAIVFDLPELICDKHEECKDIAYTPPEQDWIDERTEGSGNYLHRKLPLKLTLTGHGKQRQAWLTFTEDMSQAQHAQEMADNYAREAREAQGVAESIASKTP